MRLGLFMMPLHPATRDCHTVLDEDLEAIVRADEYDIDMARIVNILNETGYDGVIIPDRTPLMTCAAPWHAGMAYAMGYMRALQSTS